MTSFFEGEGEGKLRARAAEVGEAAALRGVSVAVGPAKPSNEGFGGCGGSRGGWSVERRGCGGLEALAGIGWLGWDGRDARRWRLSSHMRQVHLRIRAQVQIVLRVVAPHFSMIV